VSYDRRRESIVPTALEVQRSLFVLNSPAREVYVVESVVAIWPQGVVKRRQEIS